MPGLMIDFNKNTGDIKLKANWHWKCNNNALPMARKNYGGVHKGRHLLLGGEGVHQMVTQSDMEGGRGLAKGDVTSKCPKNEQIFPQESAASHKFV